MSDRATSTHELDDLATTLSEGLGEGFEVVAVEAGGYVAVVSARLGLSAVVPTDDPREALTAAEKLTAAAVAVGAAARAVAVGVAADDRSASSAIPALARPRFLHTDVMSAMLAHGSSIGDDVAAAITRAVKAIPAPRPLRPPSENLLLVAEAVVRRALPERGDAWAFGVQIDAKDVVHPAFLLPAILVSAAKRWAAPVVAAGKKGGFVVTLAYNPDAVLGYQVVGLEVSSPVLFFLPIVDIIRTSRLNGECWLDGIIDEFAVYLAERGQDGKLLADLEVRVAVGI